MDKFIKTCLVLSIVFFLVFGIALIVISYLPLNEIKALFDSYARDGDFNSFSMKHVIKLRITGIVICIMCLLIYIGRNKLLPYVSNIKTTDLLIKPKDILALIFNFVRDFITAVKKEDKIHSYAFVVIILIAIAVRVYYIFQPLYNDESRVFAMYIYDVTNGVKGIVPLLTKYIMAGNHIFHTFWAYLSYKLLGNEQSIWIMRLPVLFAGILLVPASYMVVRIFYDKNSALLASGIVASSSSIIYYSANARGHIIICLIFLLMLALASYLKKNASPAGWHLFGILAAIGFYTVPVMLLPYGVVIIWLFLSTLVQDTAPERRYLLQNLILSIPIMILLTLVFYSPVIFFGTGLKSLIGLKEAGSLAWKVFVEFLPVVIKTTWESWNKSIPVVISYLLVMGFIISVVFHKRLSVHRSPIALAAIIWPLSVMLVQRAIPYHTRYWLFLLIIYIGVASSGVTYLLRPVELITPKYKSAIFAALAVILSLWLTVNKIHSEPYLDRTQMQNINNAGEYIEFEYINAAVKYYLQFEYSGNKKVLITFPTKLDSDFWNTRMRKYTREYYNKFFISDLNSYLSNYSRACHRLYVMSSESADSLKSLLEKNGLAVSDYSIPQLMHRFNYANMYKMDRIKDCED
jgi:4-amino-4-deoxy-L-arabinose transferase-like glycosyltransferase